MLKAMSPLVLQCKKSYWQLAWCYSVRSVGKLWVPEGGKMTTNLIHLSRIMLRDNAMNMSRNYQKLIKPGFRRIRSHDSSWLSWQGAPELGG